LFAVGLVLALRDPSLRWCALVCSGFVALTWALYLPFMAVFRYSLPTTPFVAATIALGIGGLLRGRAAPPPAGPLGRAGRGPRPLPESGRSGHRPVADAEQGHVERSI